MLDAKPVRALHIPAAVLAHPSLSLLACAILAEIIDLHQVKSYVFASDDHFAKRCHVKARTVRQTIAELEAKGFLTRKVDYTARHKRQLILTQLWQNASGVAADSATTPAKILTPTEGMTTAEVVADSAATSAVVPAESARTCGRICQE